MAETLALYLYGGGDGETGLEKEALHSSFFRLGTTEFLITRHFVCMTSTKMATPIVMLLYENMQTVLV